MIKFDTLNDYFYAVSYKIKCQGTKLCKVNGFGDLGLLIDLIKYNRSWNIQLFYNFSW